MSWEIVIIVAMLCFLCVRSDFIKRPVLFILAILAWGAARLFMELNFVSQFYRWGSWESIVVVLALVLSMVFTFAACYSKRKKTAVSVEISKKVSSVDTEDADISTETDHNEALKNILNKNKL